MKNLTQNKQNVTSDIQSSLPKSSNNLINNKPPSSLLKQQILQIIKGELKTFKVRSELLNQLSEHQIKKKNKQLSKEILQSKMQAHQLQERIMQNKKLQQFQKKQKERQEKLRTFKTIKRKQHQEKFQTVNRMLEITKSRFNQISTEDSNLRLSKLMAYTSCDKKLGDKQFSRESRTSYSQSRHYDFTKPEEGERQKSLVTNYINKIKRSESRILQKQLVKEHRKQAGKKQKVKCFVIERAKHELEKMEKTQKQYKSRMQTYQNNNFKIHESRLIQQENRSLTNLQHSRLVCQRRQLIKKEKIESAIPSLDSLNKFPSQVFRNKVDTMNDSRLLQLNLKKMREQQMAMKQQATLKLIADKLQKIKDLKYGERLDERSITILLGMLDKNDPEYATISQFLQTQRKSYLQALAKKEQERSKLQKNKKTNKNLGKTIS